MTMTRTVATGYNHTCESCVGCIFIGFVPKERVWLQNPAPAADKHGLVNLNTFIIPLPIQCGNL